MVSIIVVLIGLLVPVLGSARSAARDVMCQSHLRSQITALTSYSMDHAGLIAYGPPSGGLTGGNDFFVIDGQVTNQIATETGEPMAGGLLLADYLAATPRVLFCPNTDSALNAQRELNKVGSSFALSSYSYRHGSNTLTYTGTYTAPRLDQLGQNRNGKPIRALFIDHNFIVEPASPYYNLFHQTNHKQRISHAAYYDGVVKQLDNRTGLYSATVGAFLYAGPEQMLRVFERADDPPVP